MTPPNDKLDEHFTEIVDGSSQPKQEPSEDEQREIDQARAGRALLKALEPEAVPQNFDRRIRQRIRRRTGGRYFGEINHGFGFALSIDAFIVIAVAVVATCWFLTQSPKLGSRTLMADPPAAFGQPAGQTKTPPK